MNSQIEEILKGISKSRNKDNLDKMFYPDVDISDYFFISYSHEDYRAVYKDLIKLRANNLKIWYDRDVPAGTNWKEVVNRYMRPLLCKGVIFYVSENSLRDKETTKQTLAELEYAKQIGKPIIAINLTTRVTVGDHRKDVVLSATDMLDELIKEGRHDLVAHKKEIENVFPRDVIYLPITLNPSIRAKKITDALQEAPKVIIGDLFTIDRISDSTVINVTEADFQKSLIASKLVDRDGTASFKDLHLNIEACAFSNCQSLETVSFSSPTLVVSIESIGEYAFSNCDSLKEIDFAGSLITILGAGVFYDYKKLEKLDGVFKLTEPKTFYNCESLTRLEVTSDSIFDDFCFYSCLRLKELENSGAASFVGIEQPKRKHRIGFKAFCNCQSLTMLPITQSVEEIDDYAFSYCTSLKWVYLGPNIKRVGDGAFENCVSLKTIRIDSPKLDIDFKRATFRLHGSTLDIIPSFTDEYAYRIEWFDDEIEKIKQIDLVTGKAIATLEHILIFPATHYAVGSENLERVLEQIRNDSQKEVQDFVYESVSNVLNSANITYLKWDYNRNISDIPLSGSFYYDYI